MTLSLGPNVKVLMNGALGEAHYTALMHAWRWTNLFLQASVKDMVTTLPTSGQQEGDAYLLSSTASANANQVARWTTYLSTSAWEYMPALLGWEVRLQARLDSAGLPKTFGFNGTSWVEKPGGTGGGGGSTGGDAFSTKTPAGGVLDISATTANLWGVNLNQNVSSVTLPTTADVFSMSVIFTQDSTGGRSVTWPNKVTWTNGAFSLNTAAGSKTIVSLLTIDKGATWLGFAAPATGSATGMTNPMTTKGDLIVAGDGGVAQRLAIGTEGQSPVVKNGLLVYATPAGGSGFGAMPIADLRNSGVANVMNADWWNKYNRVTGAVQVQIPLNSDAAATVATEVVLEGVDSPLTIAGVNGVTLLVPSGSQAKTRSKGARAFLKKVATDTWVLSGELAPSVLSFSGNGGYTLQDKDRGAFVRITDAQGTNVPITLPSDPLWIGEEVVIVNWLGANIQFNNGTVRLPPGKKNTSTQAGQVVRLRCIDSAVWSVSGELDGDGTASVARVVDIPDASFNIGSVDRLYVRYAGPGGTATVLGETTGDTAAFPAGAEIHIEQGGPNAITIAPGNGVTINCPAGFNKKPAKQYAAVTLKRVAKDVWTLIGYLEPSA